MEFEKLIKLPPPKGQKYHADGAVLLEIGESASARFSGEQIGYDAGERYTVRITGESDVPDNRHIEWLYPFYYRLLNESLVREGGELVLAASFENEPYDRTVYNFIKEPEIKAGDTIAISADICVLNKKETKGAKIALTADIYYKAGRSKYYSEKPDQILKIDLKNAAGTWTRFHREAVTRGEVDYIMLRFDVKNFCGGIKLRTPELYAGGKKLTGKFSYTSERIFECGFCYRERDETYEWFGDGFSKLEHPEFEVSVNNAQPFLIKAFQQYYKYPAYSCPIPAGSLSLGENTVSVKFAGPSEIPFRIKAIELVAEKNGLRFIYCPETPALNMRGFAAIETVNERQTVTVAASPQIKLEKEKIYCRRAGLHFIYFTPVAEGAGLSLSVRCGGESDTAYIKRVVEKGDDGILTGTGDSIFINQNLPDFTYFFKWYISNGIANSITFRPTYERGGSSYAPREVWRELKRLCEAAGMYYAHMLDGRTLNGADANPKEKWVDGKYFLGFQVHEKGGAVYGGAGGGKMSDIQEKFNTAFSRKVKNQIQQWHQRGYGNDGRPDGSLTKDMRRAAESFMDRVVRAMPKRIVRETDPSALFKYFYEAGMQWLGAETMYNPHNTIMGALRGASAAYGKESYGVHLAMQWGSTPLGCEPHYRRYLTELYLSYINGASEINTEEGLWRLDNDVEFERFSEACAEHKKIQQRFYKYICTHTRRGKPYIPIAALHGRYDSWTCFARVPSWAQSGEKWEFSAPEESWDLLKVFYPKERIDAIYVGNAPAEPLGYYSQSVYGVIDILPVEAAQEIYNGYSCLFFLGYNAMDESIAEKLYAYVKNGGRLILSRAHLFTSYDKTEIVNGTSPCLNNNYIAALTAGKSGKPHKLGGGEVVYFDTPRFPADSGLHPEYEKALARAGEYVVSLEGEKGYASGGENVSFTVYTEGENRYIYFVNINWWKPAPEKAVIYFGKNEFEITVSPDYIGRAFIYKNVCLYLNDNHSEILSVTEKPGGGYFVRVQGGGTAELLIFHKNGGKGKMKLDLSGICAIEIT